jgi:hypothetical protein
MTKKKIFQVIPLEPAIINADWTKNIMYPGYNPCNLHREKKTGKS